MTIFARHGAVFLSGLLLSACVAATNPQLKQARSSYQSTENDADAARVAPGALRDAEKSLERADAAMRDGDDKAADHYAYLARRHVEIAQAQAEQARLQDKLESASEQHAVLRLRAQRQRARQVQQSAEQAQRRAASLQAELRELQAERTERGILLTLGDVLFDSDRTQLKPGGQRTLAKLAKFLHAHPERRVRIEGYTDSRGSAVHNQNLSEQRASAVKGALISREIDPARLAALGLGENYPKVSNDTAAGRQQNRRVEIVISDAQGKFGQPSR